MKFSCIAWLYDQLLSTFILHFSCYSLNRSIGGEINQDGDYLVFEGNRYDRRGFLYKNFVMAAIVSILYSDLSIVVL
jgi:hypothetical protein